MNLAQGNLNSMPQINAWAKSRVLNTGGPPRKVPDRRRQRPYQGFYGASSTAADRRA